MYIGLTGMPGAGKSTIAAILKEEACFAVYRMSDIITEELARQKLLPKGENYGRVAYEIREKYGENCIAERILQKIHSNSSATKKACIDGVRTLEEILFFREALPKFFLVAVWAPYQERLRRALKPGKHVIEITTSEEFMQRDQENLALGVGDAIAIADALLVNEADGFNELKAQVRSLIKKLEVVDTRL